MAAGRRPGVCGIGRNCRLDGLPWRPADQAVECIMVAYGWQSCRSGDLGLEFLCPLSFWRRARAELRLDTGFARGGSDPALHRLEGVGDGLPPPGRRRGLLTRLPADGAIISGGRTTARELRYRICRNRLRCWRRIRRSPGTCVPLRVG